VIVIGIAAISVFDGFLVMVHPWTIAIDEQNPIGRWLIAADAGRLRLLACFTLLGTIIVVAVLLVLFRRRPNVAWIVCTALAPTQGSLAVDLTVT
jgi:hypothetical protein